MPSLADLFQRYYFAQTRGGAVTGRAPRDDALRGELGVAHRPDGGVSTELSITEMDPRYFGGRAVNVPLMVLGQTRLADLMNNAKPTQEQTEIALRRATERVAAGAMLPTFTTLQEALRAAESRDSRVKLPYYRGR